MRARAQRAFSSSSARRNSGLAKAARDASQSLPWRSRRSSSSENCFGASMRRMVRDENIRPQARNVHHAYNFKRSGARPGRAMPVLIIVRAMSTIMRRSPGLASSADGPDRIWSCRVTHQQRGNISVEPLRGRL